MEAVSLQFSDWNHAKMKMRNSRIKILVNELCFKVSKLGMHLVLMCEEAFGSSVDSVVLLAAIFIEERTLITFWWEQIVKQEQQLLSTDREFWQTFRKKLS